MTQQAAFDINWQHFVVEQKPLGLVRSGGGFNAPNYTGMYYISDECRCGIGILFPLDTARQLRDLRCGVHGLVNSLKAAVDTSPEVLEVVETTFQGVSPTFLEELQDAHDFSRPLDPDWPRTPDQEIKNRLLELAVKWHLDIPVQP